MVRLLLLACIFSSSFSVLATTKILVLGDSISAEFGLQQNQGWVFLLEKRLLEKGYHHEVVNASISGETSGGGLRRIKQVLNKFEPEIIIIELGANDGLRGLKLSQLQNNLSRMVDISIEKQAKVILVGMKLPPNYGPAYTLAFSNVFYETSKNKKVSLVPFLFQGFESNLQYFQADRVHPNAKAQILILNNIWPTLSPLLPTL